MRREVLLGLLVGAGAVYSQARSEQTFKRSYEAPLPEITWVGDGIDHEAESAEVEAAKQNVVRFAMANNLLSGLNGLDLKSIKVFSSKDAFDKALISADGLPSSTKLPSTFVGVVDADVLYACSEPVAQANNPIVKSRGDYIKLLTHEMTHALHIALLRGDETKMGPKWFFEGLAVYAADQYPNDPPASDGTYRSVVLETSKKDYRLYVAAFRRLAKAYPIAELINKASKPGFQQWAVQAIPSGR